jgi:hypothetical protein
MRVKLLALVFVVTVLALASQPEAKASVLCPAYTCSQSSQNCVTAGGVPGSEVSANEICYTLPNHVQYSVYILPCYHADTGTTRYQECYK